MKTTAIQTAISVVLSVSITLFAVAFTPFSVLSKLTNGKDRFGAAFTQLSSSDRLTDFPTTYNANLALTANTSIANSFTALNQFANASATLLSATQAFFGGTATSSFSTTGALTLITPLTVPNGGTGSTTLSSNQLLLGNGTGNVSTVTGWGTSGQALVSNGGVLAPSWQSVATDQSQNYTWTGTHTFSKSLTVTGTTTISASSLTTNPLVINGQAYKFNSSIAASSSVWYLDTNGNVSAMVPHYPRYLGNSSGFTLADTTSVSTSTPATTTVPNLLGTEGILQVEVPFSAYSDSGADGENVFISLLFDNSGPCSMSLPAGPASAISGTVLFTVHASSSNAVQYSTAQLTLSPNSTVASGLYATCASTIDTSGVFPIKVIASWSGNDGGDTETITIGRITARFLGSDN